MKDPGCRDRAHGVAVAALFLSGVVLAGCADDPAELPADDETAQGWESSWVCGQEITREVVPAAVETALSHDTSGIADAIERFAEEEWGFAEPWQREVLAAFLADVEDGTATRTELGDGSLSLETDVVAATLLRAEDEWVVISMRVPVACGPFDLEPGSQGYDAIRDLGLTEDQRTLLVPDDLVGADALVQLSRSDADSGRVPVGWLSASEDDAGLRFTDAGPSPSAASAAGLRGLTEREPFTLPSDLDPGEYLLCVVPGSQPRYSCTTLRL